MGILEEKEWLTMQDIADLFSVSLSHVKITMQHIIPGRIMIGKRHFRWSKESIQNYIDNNKCDRQKGDPV